MNRPNTLSSLSRIMLLIICLLSSSCVRTAMEPYGVAVYDGERISPERRYALMPPEAPSISQGYKPGIITKRTGGMDQPEYHYAIDIIGRTGTPILAAAPGTVVRSYYDLLYGHRVFITHRVNKEEAFTSGYNHLKNRMVTVGDKVSRGQQIGSLGHAGLLSGGLPHLHFEIRKTLNSTSTSSTNVNPHEYWFDGAGIVTCFDKSRSYHDKAFKTTYPVPCLDTDGGHNHQASGE